MGKKEKFLSLDWFKERVEESIERAVLARVDEIVDKKIKPASEKPYLAIKLVNDTLTVIMKDGGIFTKPNATELDYLKVRDVSSEEELLAIVEDKEVARENKKTKKEAKKLAAIASGISMLGKLKDFKVEDKTVVLKGTSRTIPPLLVDKLAGIVGAYGDIPVDELEKYLLSNDEYQGLKNFFMWCCLNPRAEVADDLYNFLDRNSFRITKQGFFVALRNVVTINNSVNNERVSFISNAYNKVKAVWKKNPSEYCVIETDKGLEIKQMYKDKDFAGINLGNLTQLYLDLPNMSENRFTDAHTRTFDIRVGQVVNMPLAKCSWSTRDCNEAGLHFTSDQIHYVGCGDTSVLILINPMKVVGIGTSKGRCYEYLPIMTVPRDEATVILHDGDFDTLQLDEEYAVRELEELETRAKEGFTVESTKYQFNLPSISSAEINSIVLSLSEMKHSITKRVSLID